MGYSSGDNRWPAGEEYEFGKVFDESLNSFPESKFGPSMKRPERQPSKELDDLIYRMAALLVLTTTLGVFIGLVGLIWLMVRGLFL